MAEETTLTSPEGFKMALELLTENIKEVKGDVKDVKADVAAVKLDVAELKSHVAPKADVDALHLRVKAIEVRNDTIDSTKNFKLSKWGVIVAAVTAIGGLLLWWSTIHPPGHR